VRAIRGRKKVEGLVVRVGWAWVLDGRLGIVSRGRGLVDGTPCMLRPGTDVVYACARGNCIEN